MIDLKCHQDVITLGIVNLGGWNMLAFWDHLDSCAKCREAEAELIDQLNKVINGEEELEEDSQGQE
jgi:hypothetical protein